LVAVGALKFGFGALLLMGYFLKNWGSLWETCEVATRLFVGTNFCPNVAELLCYRDCNLKLLIPVRQSGEGKAELNWNLISRKLVGATSSD